MKYEIKQKLSLPGLADKRYQDLSFSEVRKNKPRTIGGDKGDLEFQGYTLENDETILYKPVLVTTIEDLNEEEAHEIAQEILLFSFESIGLGTVES